MALTADVEELLAAWALDALDAPDAERVEFLIATDPAIAEHAAALQEVVALLGESTAVAPPPSARSRLLEAADGSGPALVEPSDPVTLLANQINRLDEVLASLQSRDWQRRAAPYRWSIHELVAHLLVIESYTAGVLGLVSSDQADPGSQPVGHLAMGAAAIAAEQDRPPSETSAAWLARARSTLDAVEAGEGPPLDTVVDFHGWPFTVGSLLTARAFEIWTHTDDIRRAVDRETVPPSAADLRTMSTLSVTSLPLLLPVVAPEASFGGARFVLTGDGGATFDIGEHPEPDVLVVADVVDYCRLAARRLTIEELGPHIEGDTELAEHLLRAAGAFAV